MMISYLTLNQSCISLAAHVGATSWNRDFLLSLVESTSAWRVGIFWKLSDAEESEI